ncbi:MAG: gliding motility-associated C-terminal domain-containing protein, partial [Sphingobacteriales bacterium]
KDCPVKIFFPNSFTPNNDGLNDHFKPVVFGPTVQYRLVIYNRYGQQIFESNHPAHGWDGRFNNEQQPIGAYVWIAHYQLIGATPSTDKGHVLMLR